MNKFMKIATITLLGLATTQSLCWETHRHHSNLSVRIDGNELPESNLMAGHYETVLDVQLGLAEVYHVPLEDISDRIKVYSGHKLLHGRDML